MPRRPPPHDDVLPELRVCLFWCAALLAFAGLCVLLVGLVVLVVRAL